MLNAIIRFSLRYRLVVLAAAMLVLGYGGWELFRLPIDVLPDLSRPRVVVIAEAPGMAPEEVEALVTFPIETVLNGATGVQAVRSASAAGVAVIYVEFDWGAEIYRARQIVNEKLQLAASQLPAEVEVQLAPISSIMGQIMMLGMWSDQGQTSPMELRSLADWVVRQRLLAIPGVSQVFVMGGDRKQFQVLVDPEALLKYGVTLHEVEQAVAQSNANVTGGYLDNQGPDELLVRSLGRVREIADLDNLVVRPGPGRPVLLNQVARVVEGPEIKRGDSSAYVRDADGGFRGGDAVVLVVNKQPGADTRKLTDDVETALGEIERTLPGDVRMSAELYQQRNFIDLAVHNVLEALRDGSILVVIVLLVFLANFRATAITLTAIPLSIVITAIVFRWFGLTINTMTLGGLAVAIGELVDDAIVDVENIHRRLRENRLAAQPRPTLQVVYRASTEIRNSIVFGTVIVVLAFLPLFALSGMEGRLFTPLGVAYVVSILASLLVSLTVTPALSSLLLPRIRERGQRGDPLVLRQLKQIATRAISTSLRVPRLVLAAGVAAVAVCAVALWTLERDFLPPFNEGAVQVNVMLPPGTSLARSSAAAEAVVAELHEISGVKMIIRRTGRAEADEHAEGVNMTEIVATFDQEAEQSREEILEEIRHRLEDVPGVIVTVEQPIAHLMSHMLSGVKAQIAVKLYGDDLETLRNTAAKMHAQVADVPGIRDLMVEPQTIIPQLRIEANRDQLALYGLRPADVNELIETAMQGRVVSRVLDGMRSYDLVVRLDEPYRADVNMLERLSVELPDGGRAPLSALAAIYRSGGPNAINREQVRRRIVLQANVSGRGLVDVVDDVRERMAEIEQSLPPGYWIEYGGQFESQQAASRVITLLFILALGGMFLVLYTMFGSANFALQVLLAVPMAFIGAVAALVFTGQTLSIAAMVGFISLCGIASRNGILLLNHYLYLLREEGETLSAAMIVRAGQERLAPVLMTALTSGIALIPLALAAGEPGKEILYPVATVIIGGLISSTLLEFFVRPALFWQFGRRAAERLTGHATADTPTEMVLAEYGGSAID